MDKQELKTKIYARIDELPVLPVVAARLLSLLEDPEIGMEELTEIISQDPALASKVLKVANSAYYGFAAEIATLDHAVAVLGLNMLKSLALSVGVVDNLPRSKKSPLLTLDGLWLHSVAVATVIKELAGRLPLAAELDHLFVVGLLHDVGKIVLLHFFHDEYQKALEMAMQGGEKPLYLAEREIIGLDHGEVGAMLLGRWKFPKKVLEPIFAHHRHDSEPAGDPADAALLRLANLYPQLAGLGADGNIKPPGLFADDLTLLGLDKKALKDMERFTQGSRTKIEAFFSAMN